MNCNKVNTPGNHHPGSGVYCQHQRPISHLPSHYQHPKSKDNLLP